LKYVFAAWTLACQKGTSDKVYHIVIVSDGPGKGFQALAFHGRRGTKLRQYDLTTNGVAYSVAQTKTMQKYNEQLGDYTDMLTDAVPDVEELAGWQKADRPREEYERGAQPSAKTVDPTSMRAQTIADDLAMRLRKLISQGIAVPQDATVVRATKDGDSYHIEPLGQTRPKQSERDLIETFLRRTARPTITITAICIDKGIVLIDSDASIDEALIPLATKLRMRVADGRPHLRAGAAKVRYRGRPDRPSLLRLLLAGLQRR
jgi:hypothetical protein